MSLYEDIKNKKTCLSVTGLGYVGLPLAVEFAKKANVIGFDTDRQKVENYINGIDVTNEVGNSKLRESSLMFTFDETQLNKARFHIVSVPTPINDDKIPDLNPVIRASESVGRNLIRGSIVVYESTVYPGVTEEICIPILEKSSSLKCGCDFKVGYSPERVNPGDKLHTVDSIIKIVSGMDTETLDEIANIYGLIVKTGVYKAESIKIAEAAKVIENTQRDINIAFMNELSIIFGKLGIDTKTVLKTAGTKWNFINFMPGLVGGHCIGVDPYYLAYSAEHAGYHPEVILSGRRINNSMGKYVAESTLKQIIKADKELKGALAMVMGFSFKEDVSDVRNTRVADIINELLEYGLTVKITDPIADKKEATKLYGVVIEDMESINNVDVIIIAVTHNIFKEIGINELFKKFKAGKKVLIDVKGIYDAKDAADLGFQYWRL